MNEPLRCFVAVTAPLDAGTARIILFNSLMARQTGGTLVVCVDDALETDAALESVREDVDWLDIAPDAEYAATSVRSALYPETAQRLVERGRADARGAAITVRPSAGETVVTDVLKGAHTFRNAELGDIVLIDASGAVDPLFRAAVDAATLGASFLLSEDRGLERAALQLHVFSALDVALPQWAHIGAVLADAGDVPAVRNLRRDGITPSALRNHLALLGWSAPDGEESFTLATLTAAFALDRCGQAPSHFNLPRLQAFNGRTLWLQDRDELAAQLMAAMQTAGLLETPAPAAALRWIDTFLTAYPNGFTTLPQALALVAELRAESVVLPALELERLRNRQALFFLDAVGQYVDAQPELRDLPLADDLPAIAQEFGIARETALAAVRMALTGKSEGAPLRLLFPLLGHDRILIRIGAINSHLLHGRGLEPIKYGPGGVPFQTISAERPASSG